MVNDIENQPSSDYSYIAEPKFIIPKESAENKLEEIFLADIAEIGTHHSHRFDDETKEQINARWIRVTLLNPKNLTDYQNEDSVRKLAKEVAEFTLKYISNVTDFEIVKISFIRLRWDYGSIEDKRDIYLTIPELDVVEY